MLNSIQYNEAGGSINFQQPLTKNPNNGDIRAMANQLLTNFRKLCKVEGCYNLLIARGYCTRHYQQFMKHGFIWTGPRRNPSKIIVKNGMGFVHLCNKTGKIAGTAIIDVEDVDRVGEYRWSKTVQGYVRSNINGNHIYLHNFILNRIGSREIQVDHINRFKTDCRKENLRFADVMQNHYNVQAPRNNTSGFKGVSKCSKTGKWKVTIQHNKTYVHLGYFKNIKDAAETYDNASRMFHGDFSYISQQPQCN